MAKSFSYFFELKKKNTTAQKLTRSIEFLEKNKKHLEDLNIEYSEANARAQLLKSQWNTSYIPALDARHALSRQIAQAKYNHNKFEEEIKSEIQWLTDDELKYEIQSLESLDRPSAWSFTLQPDKKTVAPEIKTLTAKDVCMVREAATAKLQPSSHQSTSHQSTSHRASKGNSVSSKASDKSFITCASVTEPTISSGHSETSTNSCLSTSSSNLSTAMKTVDSMQFGKRETERSFNYSASHNSHNSRSSHASHASHASHTYSHSHSHSHSQSGSSFSSTHSSLHHKSWTLGTANNKVESLELKLSQLQNETGYISTLTSLLTSHLKMLQDEIVSLQAAMTFPPENFYYPLQSELVSFKLEIYRKELYHRKQEVSNLKIRSIPLIQKLAIEDVRF